MGQLFSSLWLSLFGSKEYKIVMVGLDNAGKTTTLYRLHLGEAVSTQPTAGSNVEQIQYKNLQFEVWDLGGQANLRPSWATYYRNTDALIVVVDSTDRARISIARSELQSVLSHEDLTGAAVLVLANKQDLPDALTAEELSDSLALHSIRTHDWHIQACCATTGDGLFEGLDWVSQRVSKGGSAPAAQQQQPPATPLPSSTPATAEAAGA